MNADEYEQRIADLEAIIRWDEGELKRLNALLAARPAAPEWEPLPDDAEITIGFYTITGARRIGTLQLPPEYAICQRRPQEE